MAKQHENNIEEMAIIIESEKQRKHRKHRRNNGMAKMAWRR
jgi:hypothetical protein